VTSEASGDGRGRRRTEAKPSTDPTRSVPKSSARTGHPTTAVVNRDGLCRLIGAGTGAFLLPIIYRRRSPPRCWAKGREVEFRNLNHLPWSLRYVCANEGHSSHSQFVARADQRLVVRQLVQAEVEQRQPSAHVLSHVV
jgi:hypothetical protein